MKLIIKPLLSVMLMAGLTLNSFAQDLQLSQYDAAPMFFNPALSGNYDGLHRFIGNWKSQWKTYGTGLLSYDRMLPEQLALAGGRFGLGAMITYDRAGETHYGYTEIKFMPSYHVPLIPDNILFLSAGLDVTLTNNSINSGAVAKKINQDTGERIYGDNSLDNSSWYMDLGAGINAYSLVDGTYPINLGITLEHLLKSGASTTSKNKARIPRRFSINANSILEVSKKFAFLPSLIWIQQNPSDQVNVGTFARYSFPKAPYAVYLGSWYRIGDAVIVGAAIDFPGVQPNHVVNLGISYDFTASQYNTMATNDTKNVGNNSFEISLKYIIKKANFKYVPPTKLNPVNF